MQNRNISVEYILFPNEGRSIARPENRVALAALIEDFLKKCVGGRSEGVHEEEMHNSSALLLTSELNFGIDYADYVEYSE